MLNSRHATWPRGFSLLELLTTLAVATILIAVAIPTYQSAVQKAKVAAATQDIMTIATAIGRYNTLNNGPPPDLATIGFDNQLDPWGHPYVYKFPGQHSDFDLLSLGGDGQEGGEGNASDIVNWK